MNAAFLNTLPEPDVDIDDLTLRDADDVGKGLMKDSPVQALCPQGEHVFYVFTIAAVVIRCVLDHLQKG